MFVDWSVSAGRGGGKEDKTREHLQGHPLSLPLMFLWQSCSSDHQPTVDPPSSQKPSSLYMTRTYLLPSPSLIFNLVFSSQRTCASNCHFSKQRPCLLWVTKYDSWEGAYRVSSFSINEEVKRLCDEPVVPKLSSACWFMHVVSRIYRIYWRLAFLEFLDQNYLGFSLKIVFWASNLLESEFLREVFRNVYFWQVSWMILGTLKFQNHSYSCIGVPVMHDERESKEKFIFYGNPWYI